MASDCRLSDSNYAGLQALQREFGPFHFSVLAFPCNQFGEAEPRPSREVVSFARSAYGATFPIFHKIKVLGPEAEPAFRFLVGEYAYAAGEGETGPRSSLLPKAFGPSYRPVRARVAPYPTSHKPCSLKPVFGRLG